MYALAFLPLRPISPTPSLTYVPFSSFPLFIPQMCCFTLWIPLSLQLPGAWPRSPLRPSLPPSQHAGQLLAAGAQAQSRPRGCRVTRKLARAAKGAGRGRGSAAHRGGAGCAGCPCYIYACAASLPGQSGRRRQDGAAGDAGDRERGRTRATRAHQWASGRISGAGAGSEPELPLPASPQ